MRRKLSTSAAIASILLCAATAGVAVRSYSVCETLVYNSSPDGDGRARAHVVDVVFGAVTFGRSDPEVAGRAYVPGLRHARRSAREVSDPREGWRRWLGFEFRRQSGWTTLTLPLWSVAAMGLIAPARWVLRRRRDRRRRRDSRCVHCGYDLRATPGRCPECGALPAPPHDPPMRRTATASSGAVD
jgi:hypothetical protein